MERERERESSEGTGKEAKGSIKGEQGRWASWSYWLWFYVRDWGTERGGEGEGEREKKKGEEWGRRGGEEVGAKEAEEYESDWRVMKGDFLFRVFVEMNK